MPIVKKGIQIQDLDDWRDRAGPKDPFVQWKDHRSAKELARAWLQPGGDLMPLEVADLFRKHPNFGEVERWLAEPEAQLRFDKFAGEPRNTDMLVVCEDAHGSFLIAIEGKADETFGPTVGEALLEGLEVRVGKPTSRRIERIVQLVQAIFPPGEGAGVPKMQHLRYQLLTATAGALCEGERRQIGRVVLLVQEFATDQTVDENHISNTRDLNQFIARLTGGDAASISHGQMLGPFKLPGEPLFDPQLRFYVGKLSHNIRQTSRTEAR